MLTASIFQKRLTVLSQALGVFQEKLPSLSQERVRFTLEETSRNLVSFPVRVIVPLEEDWEKLQSFPRSVA